MTKNQILTVRIESLSGKGMGIARHDGQVIFVPAVARGDLCVIRIIKVASSYAVSKVEEILERSPDRITSSCSAFPRCGGCSFCHVNYQHELEIKKQTVIDAVTRIGGLNITVNDVVSTGQTEGYRNKAQYPLGKIDNEIVFGFYSSHSHRIISCCDCKIQSPIFNEIMKYAVEFFNIKKLSVYDEKNQSGLLRHCYLRINKQGNVMFCLVINSEEFALRKELVQYLSQRKEIVSIFLNFNKKDSNVILSDKFECIYGDEFIQDDFFGLNLRMSPDSFYQVNRQAAELLYNTAFDLLPKKNYENVYDLYCGIGSIGLSLLKYSRANQIHIGRLIGYEVVEKAINSAKINAKNNGFGNTKFYTGDLNFAPQQIMTEFEPSLIIVDPPRKGCSRQLIDLFNSMTVPNILYISCDPATLARDMKLLSENYNFSSVTPVDLFPRTAHVESVVLLSHKKW